MKLDDKSLPSLPESVVQVFRGQVGVLQDSRDGTPEFVAFKVVGVLGEGGMGTVYRAIQEYPQREVALKIMRPTLRAAPTAARFQREVEILARLRHPFIAQLYTAGSMHGPGGSSPFLAMELVPGEPVTTFARGRSVTERLRVVVDICDAIAYAHGQGVIHRDLKPANILVDAASRVKVLDFGLAAILSADPGSSPISEAGVALGTPDYMSPEQAEGLKCDERSDVFSIGVVLYELLSGRRPLNVSTQAVTEAARIIREDDPPRLRSVCPSVHPDLEVIAAKALSKERSSRYGSAAALADDLRRFLASRPIAARPSTALYRARRALRRHRYAATSGVLIFASMAVGTGLALREASRARQEQRNAQIQLAEAQVAQADMLLKSQDFARARSRYEAAEATYRKAEVSPLPAALGLWELDVQSAHPIRTLDDVVRPKSIALSPDGQLVATLDQQGQLTVSETTSGRVRWGEVCEDEVFAVEFSSDALALGVVGKSAASIRRVSDGAIIRTDKLPGAETGLVASRGYFCVACSDRQLAILPAAAGAAVTVATLPEIGEIHSFDRLGRLRVVTSGGKVLSASAPDWMLVPAGMFPRAVGDQLMFTGGGSQLSRVNNDEIEYWDLDTQQLLHRVAGDFRPIQTCVDDGAIFCFSRSFSVIDAISSDGKVLLKVPSQSVSRVAKGGDFAVVADDRGNLSVWEARGRRLVHAIDAGELPGAAADMSRDGQVVALATENRIVMADAIDGRVTGYLPVGASVVDIAIDAAGSRVVTCTTTGEIQFWHANDGFREPAIGDSGVRRVALSPADSAGISCDGARPAKVWRRSDDTWRGSEFGSDAARFAEFNDEGTSALIVYEDTAEIWRMDARPCRLSLIHHGHSIKAAHFMTDESVVILGNHGDVCMYSTRTGQLLATAELPSTRIVGLAATGGTIFAVDEKDLCVISGSGQLIRQVPLANGAIIHAAAGRVLVTHRDKESQLLDFASVIDKIAPR